MWDDFIECATRGIGDPRKAADARRELKSHLEEAYSGYRAGGMTEEAAEQAALRDMGDVEELAERMAMAHQPSWPWRWYVGAILLVIPTLVLLPTNMVQGSMGYRFLGVPGCCAFAG